MGGETFLVYVTGPVGPAGGGGLALTAIGGGGCGLWEVAGTLGGFWGVVGGVQWAWKTEAAGRTDGKAEGTGVAWEEEGPPCAGVVAGSWASLSKEAAGEAEHAEEAEGAPAEELRRAVMARMPMRKIWTRILLCEE